MRQDESLRIYIDHGKVQKLFAKNLSIHAVHERTGYPITALSKIKRGIKVDFFISRKSLRDAARKKHKRLCSCCELNPIEDGLHFLCRHCFKHAGNEGMDYHNIRSTDFRQKG